MMRCPNPTPPLAFKSDGPVLKGCSVSMTHLTDMSVSTSPILRADTYSMRTSHVKKYLLRFTNPDLFKCACARV